ncbi:hypothetical protein MKX01_040929 [Papaver californicum]|nr:hypothetical protein MKX01_040929 [Papaver californicum]
MAVATISNKRHSYYHDDQTGSCNAVDSHHIVVKQSTMKGFLLYLTILLLLANTVPLILLQETPGVLFYWINLLGIVVVKSLHWNPIKKESVLIMPGLGVQLATHFGSGRVVHRFVPSGGVLKPVLSECVTPVTCYWSLGLIVRGEAELLLKLRPPVKMLVCVQKALCSASDSKERVGAVAKDQ